MIQLRGSADGLSYLHSRGITHGSGEFDMNLTGMHDLTFCDAVKCVSPSKSSGSLLTECAKKNVLVSDEVISFFRLAEQDLTTRVRASRRFVTSKWQKSHVKSVEARLWPRCHPGLLSDMQLPSSSKQMTPPRRGTPIHTRSHCWYLNVSRKKNPSPTSIGTLQSFMRGSRRGSYRLDQTDRTRRSG